MKKFKTLYKRTSKGQTQEWTIISDNNGYYTEEGILNGKITKSKPNICGAKNIGRSNETTRELQAEIEAQAKWDKKLKTGYAINIHDIDKVVFKKPMKGDKWIDRQDEVIFPVQVQDKLNGVRCQNDSEAAKSTGGEIFYTIPHIREVLKSIFNKFPNAFIDGEAFNFKLRHNLNRLVSIVSVNIKEKDLTSELLQESKEIVELHVFDGFGFNGITKNTPWKQRHAAVKELIKGIPYVFILDYIEVNTIEELIRLKARTKRKKDEGLMIRWGDCPYKSGRSKYMLKFKNFEDAEFIILDIQEGNGDWVGCAKRIILKLPKSTKDKNGDIITEFGSNIEGDREWLRILFERKKEFIGQPATCEFQNYSEYGIPQLPFVRAIRNYE